MEPEEKGPITVVTSDDIRSEKFVEAQLVPRLPLSIYGERANQLGEGTYATVYSYRDKEGNEYAVKVPSHSNERGVPSDVVREIAVLLMLRHPNIVNVIDISRGDEGVSMVLPLAIDDLSGYVSKNRPSSAIRDKLAYDIVVGIAYCHMRGVLHRDIKPNNILVFKESSGLVAKIADFGLARPSICSRSSDQTAMMYTIWYRAPEVLLQGEYTYPADVWATACVLYRLFSGDVLFMGDNPTNVIVEIISRKGPFDPLTWPHVTSLPGYERWMSSSKSISNPPKKVGSWRQIMLERMLEYNPLTRINMFEVVRNFELAGVGGDSRLQVVGCIDTLDMREKYPIGWIDPEERENEILRMFSLYRLLEWQVSPRSVFLSVIYFDLTRSRKKTTIHGCMTLALDYNEHWRNVPKSIVKADLGTKLTEIQIIEERERILNVLNFDIAFTTQFDYLMSYQEDYPGEVMTTALGLLYMTVFKNLPRKYLAHMLSLACLSLSCQINGTKFKHGDRFPEQVSVITKALLEMISESKYYRGMAEGTIGLRANQLLGKLQKSEKEKEDRSEFSREMVRKIKKVGSAYFFVKDVRDRSKLIFLEMNDENGNVTLTPREDGSWTIRMESDPEPDEYPTIITMETTYNQVLSLLNTLGNAPIYDPDGNTIEV